MTSGTQLGSIEMNLIHEALSRARMPRQSAADSAAADSQARRPARRIAMQARREQARALNDQ